jgi:hypothetical protein
VLSRHLAREAPPLPIGTAEQLGQVILADAVKGRISLAQPVSLPPFGAIFAGLRYGVDVLHGETFEAHLGLILAP